MQFAPVLGELDEDTSWVEFFRLDFRCGDTIAKEEGLDSMVCLEGGGCEPKSVSEPLRVVCLNDQADVHGN